MRYHDACFDNTHPSSHTSPSRIAKYEIQIPLSLSLSLTNAPEDRNSASLTIMPKAIAKFFDMVQTNRDLSERLKAACVAGRRILPSSTRKKDEEFELRIDAGELIDDRYRNVDLQVNSQAKTPGLLRWAKRNGRGTHGKLATARVDTQADDEEEEAQRVLDDLQEQADEKIQR
jgi:hypothetical protein